MFEIVAVLRVRLAAPEPIGVSATNQLRLCLSMLGATPTDRHKISLPPAPEEDPTEALFH